MSKVAPPKKPTGGKKAGESEPQSINTDNKIDTATLSQNFPLWNDEIVNNLIEKEKEKRLQKLKEASGEANAAGAKGKAPPPAAAKAPAGKKPGSEPEIDMETLEKDNTPPIIPILNPFLKNWRRMDKQTNRIFKRKTMNNELLNLEKNLISSFEDESSKDGAAAAIDPKTGKPAPAPVKPAAPAGKPGSGKPDSTSNSLNEASVLEKENFIKEMNQQMAEQSLLKFREYCRIGDFDDSHELCGCMASVLKIIEQQSEYIPVGLYLWELIFPKAKKKPSVPKRASFGKYFVKLFFCGQWRIVVVDDLIPLDEKDQNILIETEHSIWPSLLMKAMFRLFRKQENVLFTSPIVIAQCLLGPFIPFEFSIHQNMNIEKVLNSWSVEFQQNLASKPKFSYSKQYCEVISDKNQQKLNALKTSLLGKQYEVEQKPDNTKNFVSIAYISPKKDLDDKTLKALNISHKNSIYSIMDLRKIKKNGQEEIILIRCVGFFKNSRDIWNGEYSYSNSGKWNAPFEEDLGFSYQDRISPEESQQSFDFWISEQELHKYFGLVTFYTLNNPNLKNSIQLYEDNLFSTFFMKLKTENEVFFRFQQINPFNNQLTFSGVQYDDESFINSIKITEFDVLSGTNDEKNEISGKYSFFLNRYIQNSIKFEPTNNQTEKTFKISIENSKLKLEELKKSFLLEITSKNKIEFIGSKKEILETDTKCKISELKENILQSDTQKSFFKILFFKKLQNLDFGNLSLASKLQINDPEIEKLTTFYIINNNNSSEDFKLAMSPLCLYDYNLKKQNDYSLLGIYLEPENLTDKSSEKPKKDTPLSSTIEIFTKTEENIANSFSEDTNIVHFNSNFPVSMKGSYFPNEEFELFEYSMIFGNSGAKDASPLCYGSLLLTLFNISEDLGAFDMYLCVIYENKQQKVIEKKIIIDGSSNIVQVLIPISQFDISGPKNDNKIYKIQCYLPNSAHALIKQKRDLFLRKQYSTQLENLKQKLKPEIVKQIEQEKLEQESANLNATDKSKTVPAKKPAAGAGAAATQKKKPSAGAAGATTSSNLVLPPKQEKPILFENERNEEEEEEKLLLSEENKIQFPQFEESINYSIECVFFSPFVVIEKSNRKKKKITQFREQIEAVDPTGIEEGRELRKKFIYEKLKRIIEKELKNEKK